MAIKDIEYLDQFDKLTKVPIVGFCEGWKIPLTEGKIRELLKNSNYWLVAVDKAKEAVVGIITALSDEVNWAFIPFLEVLPEYQGRGIGSQLMEMMLSKLAHINCVDLTCDPEKQTFYERFGMLRSHGMVIRKYLSSGN